MHRLMTYRFKKVVAPMSAGFMFGSKTLSDKTHGKLGEHPLHILVVDDQPSECERLRAAIENIPNGDYQLSFVADTASIDQLSLYNFDLCIVDEDVNEHRGFDLIKKHHLGEKLPTIVLGLEQENLGQAQAETFVKDFLQRDVLSPELVDHVIQHAYTQFHFERELAALAFTDDLTGLASKRMFEYQLDLSLKRLERTHQSLSIALFNIDAFRAVNETFGHVIGDLVLRHFANLLQEHVRPYDCVARFSADSFAIVFEEATKSQAQRAVNDIELACQEGLFINGLSIPLNCSAGISEYYLGCSVPMLIQQADQALLEVKAFKQAERNKKLVKFSLDLSECDAVDEFTALNKQRLH